MAEKEKKPKKTPKPAKPVTEGYKILQELKALHDTMKESLQELRQNL